MADGSEWEASDSLTGGGGGHGGLTVPSKKSSRAGSEAGRSRLGLEELAAEKRLAASVASPAFRSARLRTKKRPRSPGATVPTPSVPARRPDEGNARTRTDGGRPRRRFLESRFSQQPVPAPPKSERVSSIAPHLAPPRNGHDALSAAALREYEAEQLRAERNWYLGDDASASLPESTFYATDDLPSRSSSQRISAASAARKSDVSRWEQSQLRAGLYGKLGANAILAQDADHNDDDYTPRVALLINHSTPRFVKGDDQAFTVSAGGRAVVSTDVVMPVKDPTSDMAVIARKGSALVAEYREKRGRGSSRVKYWELGSAAGAKVQTQSDAPQEDDGPRVVGSSGPGEGTSNPRVKTGTRAGEGTSQKNESDRSSMSIDEVRRSLPVYTVREELLNLIRENQVVVVVGETGSGKTTQLAQYLHEEGYTSYGVVGCTQPRRVAAISVAERVAEEHGEGPVGGTVGYCIRFEDRTSSDTRIKFMTDGILLRESLTDPELDNYSVVIMDEAHERSLNTDVLFGALRNIISRRRDLKVVITSATLNAERFADFFGRAPIFRIPGRTFPVDIFFSKTPVEDYVDGAVWQVMQIHLQAPLPGDILVFMSGQEDIEATCEVLAEKLAKLDNPSPLMILPIYSQLPADLQSKIFLPTPKGFRKVVVATNIAETSLTIDGIRFVVDSGYCKLKTYNPRLGMDALLLCPASQAAVDQRAGRAGRTGPGKCYRLFTGPAYASEMLACNVPEIQRTNLGHVVLLLKSLGVKDVLDFPFLDAPPAENVLKSMVSLWHLGALDSEGDLTPLGKRMSRFPLDPGLAALLFAGEEYGCLAEAVTIVAMLSVPSIFLRPQGCEEESDAAREKFFITESDHLTLLHTYQRWEAAGCRSDWAARYFINGKSMRKAQEVRAQLVDIFQSEGMELKTCDDWDLVRQAVASAFYYQAAKRKGMSDYISMRSGVVCGMHPTSSIYNAGMTPDYVVYHELVYTKREFMSCVTAVEPQWLATCRLGPLLYTMRVSRA